MVVAFADTLFRADFTLDNSADGIIWVNQIDDPSAFGVVKLDENNVITDFVEKPQEFVSDLAIIGIYYFKDGEYLKDEWKLFGITIKDKTPTCGECGCNLNLKTKLEGLGCPLGLW